MYKQGRPPSMETEENPQALGLLPIFSCFHRVERSGQAAPMPQPPAAFIRRLPHVRIGYLPAAPLPGKNTRPDIRRSGIACLAAPQLRSLRTKCSTLKPSCLQAAPAASVERNYTTLLRSGASIKIIVNGNVPFRIPAVRASATSCLPRPPGYSAPHIRVPPPIFRALNLPCSGFAFTAKSKVGSVGFLIPLRSIPNPTYAMAPGRACSFRFAPSAPSPTIP